jgi:hypothetical protein
MFPILRVCRGAGRVGLASAVYRALTCIAGKITLWYVRNLNDEKI